jgi:hypothetical protein
MRHLAAFRAIILAIGVLEEALLRTDEESI